MNFASVPALHAIRESRALGGERSGLFTISIDVELHWGTLAGRSLAAYGRRIDGGRRAVEGILELFRSHGIHATWACVGFVLCRDLNELRKSLPGALPRYTNSALNPYAHLFKIGTEEFAAEFYFAPHLIERIAATAHQEIGTHTFSHYYCLEPGQTREDFDHDLRAAVQAIRRKLDVEVKSVVFPRNQIAPDYLGTCARHGLTAYRGNPRSWVYRSRARGRETLAQRAVRLLDSYVDLTGHHGHELTRSNLETAGTGVYDVPASRFLRPYSRRLRWLEPLKIRRILDDLTYCAQHQKLYHLWWHPENFGADTAQNLRGLAKILAHFNMLEQRYGMRSLSMSEVAELVAGLT